MIEGDYIIEEYREYEVFRDENGGILKSIPTSNYDYIRYYKELIKREMPDNILGQAFLFYC